MTFISIVRKDLIKTVRFESNHMATVEIKCGDK